MSLQLANARLWPSRELASVLVEDGRIAALDGRGADETIDLDGALLLPGFVDTHTHLGWAGEALWSARWNAVATREAALAAARGACARIDDGFWLLGGGWSRDRLPDDALPSLSELDAATGDVPAFLVCDDGSLGLVNSRAISLMKLRELGDPPGGRIDRATGRLFEGATRAMLTRDVVPVPDRHRRRGELRTALDQLPRLGITEAHDIATYPGEPEPPLVRLERSWSDATLFDELDLPARVMVRPSLHRRHEFFAEPYPRIGGLKQFAGKTYRYPGPEITGAWIREAHERGFAVSVHSLDDAVCNEVIGLFEACGPAGPRHRLVHARSLRRSDIPRVAGLGLIVEAQPWDTIDEPIVTDDPDAVLLPLRSLLDAGAHVALGSDWRDDNLEPLDPLEEIRAAVERDDGEAITWDEAVACYTEGGAYAAGTESNRGRVGVGCDADLAAIADGRVVLTVCAGRVTYAA